MNYRQSVDAERQYLLRHMKHEMVCDSESSIANIQKAKEFLYTCDTPQCREFYSQFQNSLSAQLHLSKIIKAILIHRGVANIRVRQDQWVTRILEKIKNKSFKPSDIAQFNLSGFHFSDKEKK